jgi:hypothetical protein
MCLLDHFKTIYHPENISTIHISRYRKIYLTPYGIWRHNPIGYRVSTAGEENMKILSCPISLTDEGCRLKNMNPANTSGGVSVGGKEMFFCFPT